MSKGIPHSSTSDFLRGLTDSSTLSTSPENFLRLEILLIDYLACSIAGISSQPGERSALSCDGAIGKSAWLALNVNANDQDDIDWSVGTHPGSIIWSAAVALAQSSEELRDGFITAVFAGFRTSASMATFFGPQHRSKWHITATAGAFAAASTASVLLKLSADEHLQALHLVGANIGGSVLAPRDRSGAAGFNRAAATALGVTSAMAVQASAAHVDNLWEGPVGVLELFDIAQDLKVGDALPDGVSTTSLRLFPVTGFAQSAVLATANLAARNTLVLQRLDVGVAEGTISYLDGTRGGDWWDVRSAVASAWRSKNPANLATANELKSMVHVSAIDIAVGGACVIASTNKGQDREMITSSPGRNFTDSQEQIWQATKWSRLAGEEIEEIKEISANLIIGNNSSQVWQQLGDLFEK